MFKSLTLLDYLLHAGSENVVLYFKSVPAFAFPSPPGWPVVSKLTNHLLLHYRENLYIVKTLREFAYVDDEGKDQGSNGMKHRTLTWFGPWLS